MFGGMFGKRQGFTPPIVPYGMKMGGPNAAMQRGAEPLTPEQAAMARQMTQGQAPKKKGGMFSGGKGWEALGLAGGMMRDAFRAPGQQGGNFDRAAAGVMHGRQQNELEAKQAQQQAAMEQMLQGMTPEQRMAYQANPDAFGKAYSESLFRKEDPFTLSQGQQRFGPDGRPIASVDPKVERPNLPTGMVMGDDGAEWVPGYLEGQKQIAAARGGNQQNVQSTFTGQDGQLYVVRRNGQIESTGKQVRNPYQIVDVGGVNTAVNRLTGEAQSLTSAQEVGQNKATINTIVQNEEDRQASQKDLPLAVEEVQRSMAAIDGLLAHEGFDSRYGATSMIPAIPGTAGAGAQAYIDQIGGQAFLQAFQSLKGGGQITEIEGQKATQAITRLTTQGIPPEEARQAAQELKNIMQRGLDRAKAQAGGAYAPQSQNAKPLVFNPATGEFE